MANNTNEIAELKAQIADLQRELAELKPKPKPPASENRPVRIQGVPTPHVPAEALPDAAEFLRLQEVVLDRFPILVPQGLRALPMDLFHEQFKFSFAWLLTATRREGLAGGHDIAFWINKAARFHRRDGFGIKPFLCAAVAAGDIPFSTFDRLPYDLAVGLVDADRNVDVAQARVAWQRALAGKLLTPIALYPTTTVSPPRPMVRQG